MGHPPVCSSCAHKLKKAKEVKGPISGCWPGICLTCHMCGTRSSTPRVRGTNDRRKKRRHEAPSQNQEKAGPSVRHLRSLSKRSLLFMLFLFVVVGVSLPYRFCMATPKLRIALPELHLTCLRIPIHLASQGRNFVYSSGTVVTCQHHLTRGERSGCVAEAFPQDGPLDRRRAMRATHCQSHPPRSHPGSPSGSCHRPGNPHCTQCRAPP